jgi:hypothetical protein
MFKRLELKNKAIVLRKRGYSYGNISKSIGVPKSTLSDWLKNLKLSNRQMNKLKINSKSAYLLGGKASRTKRLLISKEIRSDAISEIGKINRKEMLMLGAMLYWGEGSKQSDRSVSQPVEFVNSDPKMCKFFIKWITEYVGVDTDSLVFRVYINEAKKVDSNKYINMWSRVVNISSEKIKVYFTKDRHSNLKRSSRDNYKGQLRIVVKKSTNLNRRIAGLVEGICIQSGIAI